MVEPRGAPRLALACVLLLAAVPLAGCVGQTDARDGVIVTSQPLMDAFSVLDAEDELAGVPDWVIVDEPPEAERVGRPFAIEAEEVVRLGPELVLDQPHPLVSGPSRQALASGVQQAGIGYEEVPTEPRLATIERVLSAVGQATGSDHEPAWQDIQADLAELNATLAEAERPRALFVFPAGLAAGAGTDAHVILELAGVENAAADVGLEGYTQITSEAVQRSEVDLVIATATMHASPAEIADRPMFADTAIEDDPGRVLVVDPSHTTRLGPHIVEAATQLASWSHDELPGPRLSPTIEPFEAHACQRVTVETDAPNATVSFLGETHEAGEITVPDVEEGHYRVLVTAEDETGRASMPTLLTVEGSDCE